MKRSISSPWPMTFRGPWRSTARWSACADHTARRLRKVDARRPAGQFACRVGLRGRPPGHPGRTAENAGPGGPDPHGRRGPAIESVDQSNCATPMSTKAGAPDPQGFFWKPSYRWARQRPHWRRPEALGGSREADREGAPTPTTPTRAPPAPLPTPATGTAPSELDPMKRCLCTVRPTWPVGGVYTKPFPRRPTLRTGRLRRW